MRLHLHIELLTVDGRLADRPETIESGVRDELARVLAAHGLPPQWTVGRDVAGVDAPTMHLARAGGLTGQHIADSIHAGLRDDGAAPAGAE